MALGVLNNLSAIYAENNLNNTNNSLQTVLEQLSSGSRINSGADDAAGLSLVNGLAANSAALTQSATNATEGVGLLQVADGALSQVTNLLNRAITLATEASNGTLNSTQSSAANQEYQSILAEINNIGSTTTYNQEQVFSGKTISIYTGDSSTGGSSIDNISIRALTSANVGDTDGAISYSNGANNVFVDLSKGGQNAAVTDSLNSSGSTTITVNYVTNGEGGSPTVATANITAGSGTTYQNTAQGLIDAINDAGLGLSATFVTAAQAGSAAVSAAQAANAAGGGASDTGIEITGVGVGTGTNGAGESGRLTVNNDSDVLGGTLTIVGSDGLSHSVTLGTANSTDTLANLAATINGDDFGVTATYDATTKSIVFTAASAKVTISGTSLTDAGTSTTLTGTPAANGASYSGQVGTLSIGGAGAYNDTLSGTLTIGASTIALGTATGADKTDTLADLAETIDAGDYGVTATYSQSNKSIVFTSADTSINFSGANLGDATTSSTVASTNLTAVSQTVDGNNLKIVAGASGDVLSGTLQGIDANGHAFQIALGVAGETDTIADLATYIDDDSALGITASIATTTNPNDTIRFAATGAETLFESGLAQNTGTLSATTNAPYSNQVGTLSIPTGGASTDTLSGVLTIGSNGIALGTPGSTDTMAHLMATINVGNYGVTASLDSTGKIMTFTSTGGQSVSIGGYPVDASIDTSLSATTDTPAVDSSPYYSVGMTGEIVDTTTNGGTGNMGLVVDTDGEGGIASTGYSDSAGEDLSGTDLSTQHDASTALQDLNTAIADAAALDGYIGGQINTLNSVNSVMSTQQENLLSAQNAIQATDYASATSNMSKYEILSQTGIAALAQANSVEQEVTKLLQ